MSHEKKKHIDLFSGIGGFALAARRCGIETQVFCEQDEFCQKVLRKNFGPVPIIPNIQDFDGSKYKGSWLLTGGFPCQPFSTAGKRGGKSDDRFLWPEMLRVIDEARPRWVIGENVAGIISMELDRCISDLESIGYATRPIVVPACAVDARHRRSRVWILGSNARHAESSEQKSEYERAEVSRGSFANRLESGNDLADANQSRSQRRLGEELQKCSCERITRKGDPSSADPERNKWKKGSRKTRAMEKAASDKSGRCLWQSEFESGVCRVADGIPNRVDRLKGLGNAIVPQVAEVIIRTIIEAETLWLNV